MKEDFAGAEAEGLVTFKASYETQTKTVLNGLTPYWTASEKIAIFNGVNNEFTATVTEPSATATFKGELAGKGTKNFRAVSPTDFQSHRNRLRWRIATIRRRLWPSLSLMTTIFHSRTSDRL